jgi:thiol-disulfide isomerase/thioredoxin
MQVTVWHGPNCPACEAFAPTVAALQAKGWPIRWCDTSQYPAEAQRWQIAAIPATVIHKGDRVIARLPGTAAIEWVRAVLFLCGVERTLPK